MEDFHDGQFLGFISRDCSNGITTSLHLLDSDRKPYLINLKKVTEVNGTVCEPITDIFEIVLSHGCLTIYTNMESEYIWKFSGICECIACC